MRHRVNFLVLTAIAAVVIGAGACSSSGAPLTPTPTPIDPEALLLASGRLMKGLETFHFRLSHESGATALLPNLLVDEVEGDVMKPNRISVRFTGTLGSLAFRADLITVGDASYMTNPLTGQWGPAPGEVSPLGFFSEIDSMMAQVDQVRLVSSDGRVHRLSGRIPAEALAPLVGETVKEASVAVEFEIDAGSSHLVKATFEGRVTPAESDGTVRVITLSRFGEPVTIEPPQ